MKLIFIYNKTIMNKNRNPFDIKEYMLCFDMKNYFVDNQRILSIKNNGKKNIWICKKKLLNIKGNSGEHDIFIGNYNLNENKIIYKNQKFDSVKHFSSYHQGWKTNGWFNCYVSINNQWIQIYDLILDNHIEYMNILYKHQLLISQSI